MAGTYYDFQQDDINPKTGERGNQIDWAAAAKGISDTLANEESSREAQKAAYEKNY